MDNTVNFLLLLVILLNFFILGSSRLVSCIRTVAIQGGMLSLLPVLAHGFSGHTLFLAAGAFLLKGIAIPFLLFKAIRQVRIRREVEPLIGYVPTLILGTLATAGSFIFSDRLPLIAEHSQSLFVPVGLATLATGFLMLITRRKAITQALGYLIFENGIFVFGMLLTEAMPLMVETGVLLDLLVAVFVMAIVMHQINREFSTMNIDKLSSLKE
ncbi:MAG: hydrogenase [Proteobacteria bacterium]|nr:hydrogenase [Pseudomonadota bacterium]MBU1649264.1 hydrogenase [Pseudomonadota bacterium]